MSVLTALPVVAMAACSSAAPQPAPSPTASRNPNAGPSATLQCADFLGTDPPPSDYVVVGDAVALPGPGHAALQTSATGDAGNTRLFAKAGLFIRAGRAARLSVPASARIGWGTPGTPASTFSIPACPAASAGTGWLAYAGGYYVGSTTCLPLEVEHDGQSTNVTIGVGTACPGQAAPPSPTES